MLKSTDKSQKVQKVLKNNEHYLKKVNISSEKFKVFPPIAIKYVVLVTICVCLDAPHKLCLF